MISTVINGLAIRSFGVVDAPLTVLFIHYWGGTARTWDKTIASLLESNPNIWAISYDQRGWGASLKPEDDAEAYTIAGLAVDAEAVLAALVPKPKRVVIVGHSMGGKIAQLVAARWKGVVAAQANPATLAGLVLVAPAPPSPLIIPEEIKHQILHTYDSADNIRIALQTVLTAGGLGDELVQQVIEDSTSGGNLARQSWPERGMPEDIEEVVVEGLSGEGKVPTLIVVGEHDKIDPVKVQQEKVLPKIQEAKLEVIPSAGHLLPLEAPKELGARCIAEFISIL
jgi:pimeloyl-ACP methyl ester carboxylesterase